MKLKSILSPCALALTVLLAACTSTPMAPPDKTYKITILHTNDHHGRFWRNDDGEYGLAARKTLIDSIRQEVKSADGHKRRSSTHSRRNGLWGRTGGLPDISR